MTVEELIEELRALPQTALVEVHIRKTLRKVHAYRNGKTYQEARIESVVYDLGVARMLLGE